MSGETLGDFDDLLGGVGRVYPEDITSRTAVRTPAQVAYDRDKAMQRKIARVFGSKQGREVLAWLKAVTVDRPCVPFEVLDLMSPAKIALLSMFREGENEVVRMLILSIQADRKGDTDG